MHARRSAGSLAVSSAKPWTVRVKSSMSTSSELEEQIRSQDISPRAINQPEASGTLLLQLEPSV